MSTDSFNGISRNPRPVNQAVQPYADNPHIKCLILLEHEGQVQDCREWLGGIKGRKQIIALSPFAIYELDRLKTPYKVPEDYFSPQELYDLGMANYRRVEDICAEIDKTIQQVSPAIRDPGIKPALFSFFNLKVVYDAVSLHVFQLKRILAAENPDVIITYESRDFPFGAYVKAPVLAFDSRESLWTKLLALPGWEIPVALIPRIPEPETGKMPQKSFLNALKKTTIKRLVATPPLLAAVNGIRNTCRYGFSGAVRRFFRGEKGAPVLLLGSGHNWYFCRKELYSEGIGRFHRIKEDLKYWLDEPVPPDMELDAIVDAWEKLQVEPAFQRFFIYEGTNFYPLLRERFQFLVKRLAPICLNAYRRTSDIFKEKGIQAVIGSTLSTCYHHAAAQAAHNAGIPVVTWQHGGNGHFTYSMVKYNDLMNSDVHYFFGEAVINRYQEWAERYGTRLVTVGSAALDKLSDTIRATEAVPQKRPDHAKKNVLYIITGFFQNICYVSFSPAFSDNIYWNTQRDILDCLARHTEYPVTVKIHPNPINRETPIRAYATHQGYTNCRFVKDEPTVNELLQEADVLVIDSPSTTLLQGLTTSKPLLVYDGNIHLGKEERRYLERRVYCERDLKSFVDLLDKYLSGGLAEKDLNDREFLEKYGTYKGNSGARAAKELAEIIRSFRAKVPVKQAGQRS